ncbi:MAG: IspD/TarI family cytidylyltransferase [Oscillospiraceae bacterium]
MEGDDKLTAVLCGRPAFIWGLEALDKCPDITEIILVTRKDRIAEMAGYCASYGIKKCKSVIAGGETRMRSAWQGICAADKNAELIAIHDGARPLVTAELVSGVVQMARRTNSAVPAIPVLDTIKTVENGVISGSLSREGIYRIQTPQVFQAELIRVATYRAVENGEDMPDDSSAVQALGMRVSVAPGSAENFKITTPIDLRLAEAVLRRRGECG